MQYVRSFSGSVSKTWNSINPATLSGAIDVIVVELEDGTLACSPFHVRFGKFSLLRPSEKKVEFKVNNVKQEYSMKLGDGGEAFFVFESNADIPEDLQTSPLLTPASSPRTRPGTPATSAGLDSEPLDLTAGGSGKCAVQPLGNLSVNHSNLGGLDLPNTHPSSDSSNNIRPGPSVLMGNISNRRKTDHALTDDLIPTIKTAFSDHNGDRESKKSLSSGTGNIPQLTMTAAIPSSNSEDVTRAIKLSKKLWSSNIPTQVTDEGDLMLDMTGYKSDEDEALKAEVIARRILSEELEGDHDIGSLIGADENGNLWIYSSEEAKFEAGRRAAMRNMGNWNISADAVSDPGYQSDDTHSLTSDTPVTGLKRKDSDSGISLTSPGDSPNSRTTSSEKRYYAKTLRLTSEQLKALDLKSGANPMSFSVNRATCQACMYYWKSDAPIVISDIDGTITKYKLPRMLQDGEYQANNTRSDALGHVLNMFGRDWTHQGVAKLYTDIVANGYNILYLTSRSVGQADTTRTYLTGVVQDGYKLPKGPVIMSPDRTMAALRREVYLRKPEVFKMACLRDVLSLYSVGKNNPFFTPFYAGFGNRLTDALSYRSVNIPSTRIFTINSESEVSLDLLSLNGYKTGYVSMRELVDHYFPPVTLLVSQGAEDFTDFNYWRNGILDPSEFSASESALSIDSRQEEYATDADDSLPSEDEGPEDYDEEDEEGTEDLEHSYMSKSSLDEEDSVSSLVIEKNNIGKKSLQPKDIINTGDHTSGKSHSAPRPSIETSYGNVKSEAGSPLYEKPHRRSTMKSTRSSASLPTVTPAHAIAEKARLRHGS